MTSELHTRPAAATPPPASAAVDVLLAPTVAAVLIHELIGHGLEERLAHARPAQIASPQLTVVTEPPRSGTRDDDGVLMAPIPIVSAGRTGWPILDLDAALRHAGRPAGLSQAALHHGPPRTRCTHLWVAPAQPTRQLHEQAPSGLMCLATSGAEYLDGYALIGVSAAYRLSDHTPIAPFVLIIDRHDLHRLAIGDDVTYGRSAHCVKAGQALPTRTAAPTMLLPQARIHGG